MLSGCISTLVALALLISIVSTQDTNAFIEPTPGAEEGEYSQNNVYVEGSEVQVRWRTNFSILSLTLYQDRTAHQWVYLPNMKDVSTTTFYRWTVSLHKFNLTASNVFYLSLWNEDGSKEHFNSHYFNLTRRDPSTPSSSPSPTSTPPYPTLIGPPEDDPPSSPLSSGTKIAIGVGTSLGALGLFAIGLSIYLVRRSKEKADREIVKQRANDHYRYRAPLPPTPPVSDPGMQQQEREGSTKSHPSMMMPQQYQYQQPHEYPLQYQHSPAYPYQVQLLQQHEMESPVVEPGVRVELPTGKEVRHSRGELGGERQKRVGSGDSDWI